MTLTMRIMRLRKAKGHIKSPTEGSTGAGVWTHLTAEGELLRITLQRAEAEAGV